MGIFEYSTARANISGEEDGCLFDRPENATLSRYETAVLGLMSQGSYSSMLSQGNVSRFLVHANGSVDTIYSQIKFTKDYQDLGIASPVWLQVVAVVMREGAHKIFSDIAIDVTTGDLEVFADPMFSKVCYNLLENALRHGERVTRITVSWKREVDYGILIFEA